MTHIALAEWERKGPDSCPALSRLQLPLDRTAEALLFSLAQSGKLEVLQLPRGVEIRARSWVGQVTIGDLIISVRPKIQGTPLLTLLRYAYSLRDLRTFSETEFPTSELSFADLLITQLATETAELLARGLHRDYLRFEDEVVIPRGRVSFTQLATATPITRAALPCTYFERSESIFINRLLLSGLQLAWQLTADPHLKRRVAGLAQALKQMLSPEPLSRASLEAAAKSLDRRTRSYAPVLTLIQLLVDGYGFAFGEPQGGISAPGFLFDMNAFFQALISRFLRDSAPEFTVRDQHRIHDVFASDSEQPLRRAAPTLRPDFAIFTREKLVELVDAKYRDLWDLALPAEMLYQLSMYALANPNTNRAVILYPTLALEAIDQLIRVRDPVNGSMLGTVILRPVNLLFLAKLSETGIDKQAERTRLAYAQRLVFGER